MMAFMVDDLLDFTADQTSLGKPIGGDLREGKVTLAAIRLLQQTGKGSRADEIVRNTVNNRTVTIEEWAELGSLLREHQAIDYAYDKAVEHAKLAKKQLEKFPPSSERDALHSLPDYVLARDR